MLKTILISWSEKSKYIFIFIGIITWCLLFIYLGKNWEESASIEEGKLIGKKQVCTNLEEKLEENKNIKEKLKLNICTPQPTNP